MVEDNEANRDMLVRRLELRGFLVAWAGDGREAIRMAKEWVPELILMDMSLPTLSGWDATKVLKANEDTKAIPVIALTAHALLADREKALEAGCDGFHSKPVEFDNLLLLMREQLER